jgi:hypothetical protein
MIGQLGMGTTLISSAAMEYPAGGIVSKVLSNDGGRAEVENLLAESKASVTRMLEEHRNVVEALRDALLDQEELIGDDILQVIRESQPSGSGWGNGVGAAVGAVRPSLAGVTNRISLGRDSASD